MAGAVTRCSKDTCSGAVACCCAVAGLRYWCVVVHVCMHFGILHGFAGQSALQCAHFFGNGESVHWYCVLLDCLLHTAAWVTESGAVGLH